MKDFFNSDELEELIKKIQNRGGEIIKKQNLSSGLSAANAICHHLKDLFRHENEKEKHLNKIISNDDTFDGNNDEFQAFSCGTLSDGNTYGIPNGLVYSFPCFLKNGEIKIIPNLNINNQMLEKLNLSVSELLSEKLDAETFLNNLPSSKL